MNFRRFGFLLLAVVCSASPLSAQNADQVLSRIAFGSCADQNYPMPVWDAVLKAKPDVFLMIGDNIYGDTEDIEVLRAKYEKLGAVPGFKKLRETIPVLAVWDDHDYGVNDGGVEYPKKVESQQVFLDFFGEPADSPRRKQEGVYDSRIYGPDGKRVQIILLDTRYHRSPLKKRTDKGPDGPYDRNHDAGITMLGEAQWKWLEEQLKMPAEVRIIASSIQVVPEDHHWELWMNMPVERQRLFNLIRDTSANGVLFISGDRHLAELSVMDAGVGYPIFDLTSSSLNKSARKFRPLEENRHRVGTMNWGDNFGLIAIDWQQKDPQIRLQVRDDVGDVIIQRKINLSTLQAK